MEALKSDEPFYAIHKNAKVNAAIDMDDRRHRAFLVAKQDIQKDEEIFCHYGFIYWFTQELQNGFLQEDEIDEHGFPETFHQYPAFINYLKAVYPECTRVTAAVRKDHSEVFVHYEGTAGVCIPIPNFRKLILRVHR